ncbi:MAG: bifunctional (p)ppGpp synthetase/guanosine-3',5'-bis(diphosphate) 3'-pyrophosphohydrolase [Varibaculum sp.]|nr:bifunctional (p)ppGpp synthetase/guanosine-3',5'-bis(diphosphate) 3'-pyrophosphohydrolase [Varibaculum sp.]
MSSHSDSAAPVPSSRVRSSLAWFSGRSKSVDPQIQALVRTLRANHPKADIALVERAYKTAERLHEGVQRKSGEPYITHPVAVATILAEIGMTDTTIAAGLLHDTVEDTDYSLEQLTTDFGEEIALLVDGVTKLDKVKYGEASQAETVRKMVIAMSKDIRVLVIKLADRLHNARTWKYVSKESASRKAQETLEIYAPLAHRLGMNTIKWELEDLSFRTLYPNVYAEIDHLVQERSPQREEFISQVIRQIEEDLRSGGISGEVTGRPKHNYSIYQKMIVRGRQFDDIYDLVGARVLVNSVRDCYAVLGAVHARWNPIPGRFKDYIAMPKFNLYQSLHTTVRGPQGRPVEIQIRTHEMHRRAEYGVAAHWKYKEDPNATSGDNLDKGAQMGWLRQLVDWQRETQDPTEFLDSLRYEMGGNQVYVFTPRGEIKVLSVGATPIDFAYSVHTEVGNKTVGAKVNGRLVPLDTKLDNGDTVEVLTSKSASAGPSRDWLNFVVSPRTRNKIKSWFSKERKEEAIDTGQNLLAQTLRKQNLPLQRLMEPENMLALAAEFGYQDISGLYAAVGEHHISPEHVVHQLLQSQGGEAGTEETLSEGVVPTSARKPRESGNTGIVLQGMDDNDMWIKLAHCCTPVPGDDVIGFVTRGHGISVHRTDCGNVANLRMHPERMIEVQWADNTNASFLVNIEIRSLDREGLLNDISKVLTDYKVNILSGTLQTGKDRIALSKFSFEMPDAKYLNTILSSIQQIEGVFSASRTIA